MHGVCPGIESCLVKRRRVFYLLIRRLDSSVTLAAVKQLSRKDRSIVVVVEAKGCQLTFCSSLKVKTKPAAGESKVLALCCGKGP